MLQNINLSTKMSTNFVNKSDNSHLNLFTNRGKDLLGFLV